VSRTGVRVRYPETDRMGVAYHGSFLVWFELGRTELLREAGRSYREMEEEGWMLPVVEAQARYLGPALYDDELVVETVLEEMGRAQLSFGYRITRPADGRTLATGRTRHAVLDARRRPARLPDAVRALLEGAPRPGEG